MRAIKYLPHYTVEDYHRWEGNWELIDGIPYAMSPSPTRKHQLLATYLLVQIEGSLRKQKDNCGDCQVVHELDWIIGNNTVVRPDVAIICDEDGDFISKSPELIIEIISPSTALNDRQLKFELYQEQGVGYYILVDPTTKTKNIFALHNGKYAEHNQLVDFALADGCNIQLDVQGSLDKLE